MIKTQLQDIVPLVEIGEAWVQGMDPSLPQYVDQLRGKAHWAKDGNRGTPFYKVIQQRSLELEEEVEEPTCVIEWPTGRHTLYLPEFYKSHRPYQNRQHTTGIDDCYTLIREWYAREMQIPLPEVHATRELMLSGTFDLFDSHPDAAKWQRVVVPQPGDVVLFKFSNSKSPNHCGVMLEENWFLHHFFDRLSTIERLTHIWRENVCEYRRYLA